MGIELPVELTEVAAKAGVSWPKADEDAMRSSAAAWREAGNKIKTLGTSSDGAAGRALEGLSGAAGDAARGRWAKVVAPDGDLQRAARGCHAAADRLDHAAAQVGAAKVEIVRELVTLAKNNDAATASAQAGNPNALLGLDTLTKGTAANVANLHNTLSSAIRLDSGVDMSHGSQPVNTAPGAHGPGGGGGLLSPVTNVVGGVVDTAAPVTGAVTAPVGAVTAPVVGAVNDVAAPVLNAAAPATAPAAAVVQPALEVVDGNGTGDGGGRGEGQGKGLLPGLVDGNGSSRAEGPSNGLLPGLVDGNTGDAGRGEGPPVGRGENKGVLPGLVADTGQAIGQAVGHVTQAVPEAIPSVQGTLGPVAEGTTQASAAVLDQPLIRGGEMHGQPAAAVPQGATPAAPAAQPGPAMGSPLGGGGPVGGPVGGAVGAAVGGVASAAPAAAGQVGAVVGQQGGAQAAAQSAQAAQAAQQGQQAAKAGDAKAAEARAVDAKAVDAKAAEAKAGEARAGAQAMASKTGGLGAGQAAGVQAGSQVSGQSQPGSQGPSQGQSGSQTSGQAPAGGKDALAKDAAKDALLKDAELGDGAIEAAAPGGQKVGDTIAAPAAPTAGVDLGAAPRPGADLGTAPGAPQPGGGLGAPLASVDLGGHHTSGSLTDRLDSNRDQAHALADPGLVGDIARHAYTAVAAGSWFMAIFLSTGQAPRLAPKPARQLPPPPQEPEQQVPTFAPNDHPQADLVDVSSPQAAEETDGLGKDHPVVQELLKDYDPLAGMHERDWESLFQNEDGTPRWPVEREGGYEDSQPEVLKAGAELDRFGTTEGRVLSTAGTPFKERSLPPGAAEEGYRRYRVTKDLPVHRTISAPWFGQPGGGARYRTTYPVADLVALGYLTEITA
ncbi:TNT domain-containing protein [Lentzea aerocolonigenes]|uniref:TNT domain-containing protein n=1 Tax=Lentzea aerocolonigenes TaxID=68170 RepID=UPI0005690BC5|nr:TNT domain-containing protein [Lentzea aerocolonigenes]MCP2249989.1 Protein of unknown function (DUF4237) [Lentzea aerocolonigenes]